MIQLLSIKLDRSRQSWRERERVRNKHLYMIQLLSIELDRSRQSWRERERELETNIYI